jgi:hypothetical protein
VITLQLTRENGELKVEAVRYTVRIHTINQVLDHIQGGLAYLREVGYILGRVDPRATQLNYDLDYRLEYVPADFDLLLFYYMLYSGIQNERLASILHTLCLYGPSRYTHKHYCSNLDSPTANSPRSGMGRKAT